MSAATYADTETGLELQFRPAKPWEQMGMTKAVMDIALPDGRSLWGEISENMGTSRDMGRLYLGCPRPGPDDGSLDEAVAAECQVWEGVIYALSDGKLGFVPTPDEPAPESLILSDIGRKLRYAVFTSPGEEPWDQFRLTGCAQ